MEKSEHHHWILHVQISIGIKFQPKLTILDQIYPKRVFPVENRKSEHPHWILHMWTGLGTKLQLRLTILMFWAEFAQKGCFRSKTKNSHLCVCPWSVLAILNFFALGADRHNGICNKTKQSRGKRLLIRINARRRVKRVRRILMMGKACRRV